MSLELQIADEKEAEEWKKIVDNSSQGTIFHTWAWLKIVEKQTKSVLYPLIGYKGTEPIGVYPLFLVKKSGIKLVFSPPSNALLLYMGPAFVNFDKMKQSRKESLFTEFQTDVDEFIKSELKANYVRIRTAPGLVDSRPLRWNGYEVEPLYTYMIDLTKGVDYAWNGLNRKLRTSIERSKREGVEVKMGDKEDLEFIRVSLYRRFEKQGLRPQKEYYKNYLSELFNAFYPENMKIFVANYKGEKVGGLVVLYYKEWSALWIGIPKTELKGIYPNDLAQWEAIKWSCEHGFKYYEEMDAGDDPRLRHFKAKFNPESAIWFSAVKYSSPIFKGLDKTTQYLYNKLKMGRLI
jgi:lipid II:glycine glycyltransferase (peptidoglycan interpeptide bridge formation enzyme)